MRHAAVTFVLTLALRLFGVGAVPALKVGTVASIGGEIVQWHVGPCYAGRTPIVCGKPERRDAFAGIGGTLAALALTIPLSQRDKPMSWPKIDRRKTFDDIDARRRAWKERNAQHPDVLAWLAWNLPPNTFGGDVLDWAWLEMPFAPD